MKGPTLEYVRLMSAQINEMAQARGLRNVRVFGSVARGDATVSSDLDLLVRPGAETSIFDLSGFMDETQELLGLKVDVVSDRGPGPRMDQIRAEAVPLYQRA